MTELRIRGDASADVKERLTDPDLINERLAAVGARFERIPLRQGNLDHDASQDEVIELHREALDGLMQRYRFATVDVVGLSPRHPRSAERRLELGRVHRHDIAEGRLIVDGRVICCLQAGDRVFSMQCQGGDFIGLPAETPHWLQTGNPPDFRSVRLFTATAECPALPSVASGSPRAVGGLS